MNGISRWVWGSMPPGITKQPAASSIVSPVRFCPIALIVSPSTSTSETNVRSAVTTVPSLMTTDIRTALFLIVEDSVPDNHRAYSVIRSPSRNDRAERRALNATLPQLLGTGSVDALLDTHPTTSAVSSTACMRTCAPAVAHSCLMSSASLWLTPSTQGVKIIEVGATRAI